jgi:hypothetical protein
MRTVTLPGVREIEKNLNKLEPIRRRGKFENRR